MVASSLWGSFFAHPTENEKDGERREINTFWGDIIQRYSKICIPILDYLAGINSISFFYIGSAEGKTSTAEMLIISAFILFTLALIAVSIEFTVWLFLPRFPKRFQSFHVFHRVGQE